MLKRKRAMSIQDIMYSLWLSPSHIKNSLTSQRELSRWLPEGKMVVRTKKDGVNKYKVANSF